MMAQKTYNVITSIIFIIVGVMHLLRIVYGWSMVIGTWTAPLWVSWIGVIVALALVIYGLKLSMER